MDRLKSARDIMAKRLVTLTPNQHVFDGIDLLLRHKITGAPVVEAGRKYRGVFSEKCCMSVLTTMAQIADKKGRSRHTSTVARDFMIKRLVTLTPNMDVFDAVGHLLRHRISGAPVVDGQRNFLGVFSEKTSMQVLIQGTYEQHPSAEVGAFMNEDFGRTIPEDMDLLSVAHMFLNTPYRRLPVLRDGRLMGQISRRDVLRVERAVSAGVPDRERALLQKSEHIDRGDGLDASHNQAQSADVSAFMDRHAPAIDLETNLLAMARLFLDLPHRRLPVLRDGTLVGQVSRRDVLQACHHQMRVLVPPQAASLYLSAITERSESHFQ